MTTDSKIETLRTVINSRLLFNTKEEAEGFLGIKLKNIRSENNIRTYIDRLEEKAELEAMTDLKDLVDSYSTALEQYNLDGGLRFHSDTSERRTREEVRKILAVRLFVWTFLGHTFEGKDRSLRLDERGRFPKDTFRHYCPEPGGEEAIDVCFTVLFNWNIVSPNGSNTTDYRDGATRSARMLELVSLIKKELPRIGIFEAGGLPQVNMIIRELDFCIHHGISPTSAAFWLMLRQIGVAALASSAGDVLETAGITTYGLALHGIWKDNVDNGVRRFWVFPSNYHFAFSFELGDDPTWHLKPYEFFTSTTDVLAGDEDDFTVWMSPEHTMETILKGGRGIDSDNVAYAKFDYEVDEADRIKAIEFLPMKPHLPQPLPWRRLERVEEDDYIFSLAQKALSLNHLRLEDDNCLINVTNALVGIDNDYIYLYDYPLEIKPFKIETVSEGPYPHTYEYRPVEPIEKKNIPDLVKNHAMVYRIPRHPQFKSDTIKTKDYIEKLNFAIENIKIDSSVTIYHFGENDHRIVIFFNDLSVGASVAQFRSLLKLQPKEFPAAL